MLLCLPRREGAAHETGFTVWDPLGLADLGSPATLAWFRHAELKHCRVAMAAFTGWLVATGNQLAVANGHEGLHFPGAISPFQTGTTFADIAAAGGPMEQWQMVPEVGKLQILGAIFIIEHQSEWKIKPHCAPPPLRPPPLRPPAPRRADACESLGPDCFGRSSLVCRRHGSWRHSRLAQGAQELLGPGWLH